MADLTFNTSCVSGADYNVPVDVSHCVSLSVLNSTSDPQASKVLEIQGQCLKIEKVYALQLS